MESIKKVMVQDKYYKINKYITLKLIENRTYIFIDGTIFRQCVYLLLNIPNEKVHLTQDYNSIDEAAENLNHSLENNSHINYNIPANIEFWGHCSNLQAWVEHEYDSRLLHRNLAFPLLKRLTEAGDPIAKRVFKEEIAKRILSGCSSVINFLIDERYLDFLNKDELKTIMESYMDKSFRNSVTDSKLFINYLIDHHLINMIKFIKPHLDFKEWNELGAQCLGNDYYNDAIFCFTKALEIKPDDLFTIDLLSQALSYPKKNYSSKEIIDKNLKELINIPDILELNYDFKEKNTKSYIRFIRRMKSRGLKYFN